MPDRSIIAWCLAMTLTACGQPPDLGSNIASAAQAANFPSIVPLQPVLDRAAAPNRVTATSTQAITSGASNLRARADALRGPVVDSATRARMNAGIGDAALR